MKVRHTLICFFVLTLQAGNTGLLAAGRRIVSGTEGESVTVACSFTFSGDRKFFCKQECKEDILVNTTSDSAKNGRYRIEYSKTFFLSYPVLYVSISQLTKSDSGQYKCGLGRPLFSDSHEEFEIIVRDASASSKTNLTLGPFSTSLPSASKPITTTQGLSPSPGGFTSSSASPKTTKHSGQQQPERTTAPPFSASASSKSNLTIRPFSTLLPSASKPITTQGLAFSSGGSTSLSASPKTTKQSGQQQPERTTAPAFSGKMLYVGVIVVATTFLLSLAMLVFFRRSKPKGPPMERASVSDTNRVHEDISEDRNSRSVPVESFSVDLPNSTIPLLNSAPAGSNNDFVFSEL